MNQQEILNTIPVVINELVEQVARERGYNGEESLASYINSNVSTWTEEDQVFVVWLDQVQVESLGMMSEVEAGNIPIHTMSQTLGSILPIQWPEV